MKHYQHLLREVSTEMHFLIEHVSDQESLQKDPVLWRAVSRSIQIIGEAAKKIPEDVRASHPDVPWREMTAMRDVIVHEYDDLDPAQLWKTIAEDIPKAVELIDDILQSV